MGDLEAELRDCLRVRRLLSKDFPGFFILKCLALLHSYMQPVDNNNKTSKLIIRTIIIPCSFPRNELDVNIYFVLVTDS